MNARQVNVSGSPLATALDRRNLLPMQIIDGKHVAAQLRQKMVERAKTLTKKMGRAPGLAVVLVGEDPASQIYVANKVKACEEVGIRSLEHRLPTQTTQEQLHKKIQELNENSAVDGILVQLPLPDKLSSEEMLGVVSPLKDADCLTPTNLGLLWSGKPRTTPCTPNGVMELLKHYAIPLTGRRAAVVGRSNIVGKPMAQLLLAADATVTICHSRTKDLASVLKEMDVVVVAAGRAEFLGRESFKKGAVVIDVGIHRIDMGHGKKRICGDVRFDELKDWVSFITPVPGGVGPMTIAMLLENTLHLCDA